MNILYAAYTILHGGRCVERQRYAVWSRYKKCQQLDVADIFY